jgi:hypothetical protein
MLAPGSGNDSDSRTARLHYEIWKISRTIGDPSAEDHRLRGLQLYQEIIKSERTLENKQRIRELGLQS